MYFVYVSVVSARSRVRQPGYQRKIAIPDLRVLIRVTYVSRRRTDVLLENVYATC